MAIGQSELHESAKLHVTGAAVYTDDIAEPTGCLHACVLKSPYAHARISKIDTSGCWDNGVFAVMTAQDIPGLNDVAPAFSGDPIFADGKVFYAGQSVLAVAAETLEMARVAAQKAVVNYEELPAILSINEAIKQNSFVGYTYGMKTGDSTAALAKAVHNLEGTLEIGGQDHFYLEGQISLATPLENGGIHCWSSTQNPTEVQHLIAKMLNLSEHDVVVEVRRMGGAFGGKESQASLIACIAAALAWKTKRPVKLRLNRDEDMIMTGKRHDMHVQYKVGFDDMGMISGIDVVHSLNCGMSADLSNAIADRAMFHTDNTYYLGDATITSYRCKTNKVSNTAFRGFGGPQGMLVIEYIIDDIARKLGKDPLEVRKVNLYDPKGLENKRCRTHYDMKVKDNIAGDIIAQLEKTGNYSRRVRNIKKFNASSRILKKGIALTPVKFGISFTLTSLNQGGALVHIYKDGSVLVNHGGTEMGQGLHTKIIQVVAEEFQIDANRVKITATTTGKVPNTSPTAASTGSDINGKAAQAAAKTIKERLVKFARRHFSVGKKSIVFSAGNVHVDERVYSFAEFIHLAYLNRISLSATGFYKTPKIYWDRNIGRGRPFYYFSYGAAISEVIIDTLTGEYKILRSDILYDVGHSLNPAIDQGQIEGGFIQGAGWLTSEELWWDDKGVLKTHAPSTYKIPTGRDVPTDFRVALYNNENSMNTIYKSKAVGEPPIALAISVFLALRDAIAAIGIEKNAPRLNAPATPEEVLRVISARKKGIV